MKKIVKLTESDLIHIVKRVIEEGDPFSFGDKLRGKLGKLVGIPENSEDEKALANDIMDKVNKGEYKVINTSDGIVVTRAVFSVEIMGGKYIVTANKERLDPMHSYIYHTYVKLPNYQKVTISGKNFTQKLIDIMFKSQSFRYNPLDTSSGNLYQIIQKSSNINSLNKLLDQALDRKDYDMASWIQKRLRELKQ